MMKNGTCPKCGSHEIYHHVGNQTSQELVTLVGGVISKGVAPDKYACVACGYLEYYLPLNNELQAIREHWERVNAQ